MEEVEEVLTKKIISYNVEQELPSMIELFSIQSYTGIEDNMRDYVISVLKQIEGVSFVKDHYGNLIVTKGILNEGEYYPCLISHLDTVHDFVNGYRINIKKSKDSTKLWATCKGRTINNYEGVFGTGKAKTSYSNLAGIGGDDGAGIWICLKLLKELPILKIVFTVQEESGAIGASKLSKEVFSNVGYLIEGDRRGNSDLITSINGKICSDDFLYTILEPAIEHGYNETFGMLTDIEAIRDNGIALSAINVSVGYYNPHSFNEYIIVEDLLQATEFIKDCISCLGYNIYPFEVTHYYQSHGNYDYYDDYYYSRYGDFDDYLDKTSSTCNCTKELTELNCDKHNRIIMRFSGHICKCGEELEEREYSLNCPYCSKIYVL